jgi:hypothetical protein
MTYGMIMNPDTFNKLKSEGSVKETNGVTFFEGIIVGIHKKLDENTVIKCKNKQQYVHAMTLLDLGKDPNDYFEENDQHEHEPSNC